MTEDHPVAARYLQRLESSIGALEAAEQRAVLEDIRNHIAEAMAAGRPLAAVLESLGSAESLARAYEVELLLHPRRSPPLHAVERFIRVAALVALSTIFAFVPVAFLAVAGLGFTLTGFMLLIIGILESAQIHLPGVQMNGVSPAWAIALGPAVMLVGLVSLVALRWSVRLLSRLVRKVLPRNMAQSSASNDLHLESA